MLSVSSHIRGCVALLLLTVACGSSSGAGPGGTGGVSAATGGLGGGLGAAPGSGGLAAGGTSTGGARASGASSGTGGTGGNTGGTAGGAGGGVGGASGGASGGAGGSGGGAGGGGGSDLGLTASEAAAAMGHGVNLGQMFESTQHPRTLAAASAKIDAYYARGFRNIRIPITWTEPVGGELLVTDAAVGIVDRSHPRLAVIESVIDHALSKPGLYVIINAHHEETLKTESRAAVLEQLWTDVADIFRDKDHRLLFEILNEPHRADSSAMPAADLRNMVGLAYAKIRAVDPARIVLFGGNQWFGAQEVPTVWTNLDLLERRSVRNGSNFDRL